MKFVLQITLGVALLSYSGNALAIESGDTPPAFTLASNTGSSVTLSQYQGKVIYLDFWASWCATCADSLKWMEMLQKKYGDDNFQVIAINVDEDAESARALLDKAGVDLLVVFDPKGVIPEAYNVSAIPSSYLIDKFGKVLSAHKGLDRKDMRAIEESIQLSLEK